jgi:NADH dehydrogenase
MGTDFQSRVPAALAGGIAGGAAFWAARRLWGRQPARPGISRPGAPRVLILGAGFGGLTTAIELGKLALHGQRLDVTLIDRVNAHLFTPMLYQVATGLVEPGHVTYPARAIARDYGFRFQQGQIETIDLDARQVVVAGERVGYDRLVIALGSVTNYFGNASIERSAASLKTLGDAVTIRNQVLDAFEQADRERDVATRQALLTFVVVGGGATGVELAGSLYTLLHNGLLPTYPSLDPREVRVILVEAGKALLNGMDPWLGEATARRIQAKGVELRLANPATEVTLAGIAFKDGQFVSSRTVIWAAGIRPSPLAAALNVEHGRDGRLVVDQFLRLPTHPDVSVLGDCAWFPLAEQEGRPAPPNAQTAVREAPVVAQNIVASLHNEPLTPFHYASEGNLVALGQGDGVALIGERRLEGFPAWLTWRGYYLTQLLGFKNRLAVLVEWTSAYFGHRATARLDIGPLPPQPAAVVPPNSLDTATAAAPQTSASGSPSHVPTAGSPATGSARVAAAPATGAAQTARPTADAAIAADATKGRPRTTVRRKPPATEADAGPASGGDPSSDAGTKAAPARKRARRKPPTEPDASVNP